MQTPARAHRASKRARASVTLARAAASSSARLPNATDAESGSRETGRAPPEIAASRACAAAADEPSSPRADSGLDTTACWRRWRSRAKTFSTAAHGRDARPGRRNQHRKRGPPVQLPRGTVRQPLVEAEDERHVDGGAGRDGETPSYSFSVANGAELRERRNDQYPRGALPPSDQPAGLRGAHPERKRLDQGLHPARVRMPYLPTAAALHHDRRRPHLHPIAIHLLERVRQGCNAVQGEVAAHEPEPQNVVGERDYAEFFERHVGQCDAQSSRTASPRRPLPRPCRATRSALRGRRSAPNAGRSRGTWPGSRDPRPCGQEPPRRPCSRRARHRAPRPRRSAPRSRRCRRSVRSRRPARSQRSEGRPRRPSSDFRSASRCSHSTPEHVPPRPPITNRATSSGAGTSRRTGGSSPTTRCQGPGVASRMTTPMASRPPSTRAAHGSSRRATARSQLTSRACRTSRGPS